MSLFAFLGGRHDRKAWGRALFASGCRLPDKMDKATYEKLTAKIIANDCKVIKECAGIICRTRSQDVRSKRKMMMFSRIGHLSRLEPYANKEQKVMIREAKAEAAKARRVK